MMHATDLLSSNQLPPVGKQALEKVGFKVDLQSMDWQTVVTRRAKKDPPAQGGWNIFYTTTVTVGTESPAGNSFTSGGCEKAWFGWPCDSRDGEASRRPTPRRSNRPSGRRSPWPFSDG